MRLSNLWKKKKKTITDTRMNKNMPSWMQDYWSGRAIPGYAGINELLTNPGKTDQLMVNRMISSNARGTQQQQAASQAQFARSGFGGSGLGAAMQSAIANRGMDRQSDIYAQEARRREDLKREDLANIYPAYINPYMQAYGADRGVSVANDQNKTSKKAAIIGGLAAVAAGAAAACKTAEELYGVDAEETMYARYYMGNMADEKTKHLYGTGSELAERVKDDPKLRAKIRPIFDTFVEEAKAELRA